MMNKKELAEVERLKTELLEAKALRFTDLITPDVDPPDAMSDGLAVGFVFNSYGRRIEPACSSSCWHAVGRQDKTTSQMPIQMYSTRLLAMKAMRAELEREYARELAQIDRQIEALTLKGER